MKPIKTCRKCSKLISDPHSATSLHCKCCLPLCHSCQLNDILPKMKCDNCQKISIDCRSTSKINNDHMQHTRTLTNYFNSCLLNDDKNETPHNYETEIIPHHSEDYYETSELKSSLLNKSSKNQFIALAVNIRSIANINNFTKLEALVFSLHIKPDVIAVTETWIKPLHSGPFQNLLGYKLISNCRQKYIGGGVAFYVKDNIEYTICDDLTIMNEKIFESVFLNIKNKNDVITCGAIYRSPLNDAESNQTFRLTLQKCLKSINSNQKCYLFGDFNYDLAKTNHNTHVDEFSEIMFSHSFYSLINKPTRITDTSSTIIDHIWTNTYSQPIKSGIILHPISDHMPVIMSTNMNKISRTNTVKKRNFTNENIINFNQELEKIDISTIVNQYKPNHAYEEFISIYLNVFNKHFPKKQHKKMKNKDTWFNDELQKLLQEKQKLLKKYCLLKTPLSKANYNFARNKYFHALQIRKQEHYAQLFKKQQNNMKQTWNTINTLLGKTKQKLDCSSININNKLNNDAQTIAHHFNNHFANVASKLLKDLPVTTHNFKEYLPSTSTNSLYINPTTPQEIKNIISGLKPKTSCGIDEIPTKLLKSTPENILFALSYIFNLSFETGEYINSFKIAKVIPIYKKGSANDVQNYRPISILPVMSKIMEKLMYKRLLSFLNRQHFFYKYQFGFRKNHSTSHATALLAENICKAFEKKQTTIGVFLDLSKAFDTIDHRILLAKLQHYGVRGLPLKLFQSYLTNRSQQVLVNGKFSNCLPINYGVPQGSILGPLLFLIYVNDFPKCLSTGNSIMFADDTNIFFSEKNYKTLFAIANQQLQNIDNWLTSNKLSLNTAKTNYIIFHTPHSKVPNNLSLQIRNTNLKRIQKTKFLGVVVQENLSWKPHMEWVLKKIRICYCVTKKIRSFLNNKTFIILYNSLIKSHLQYCILTWCNGNTTMVQKLQSTSNNFIRLMFGLDRRCSVKHLSSKHSILNINQLMETEIAHFMYKYHYDHLPPAFDGILNQNKLYTSLGHKDFRLTRSKSNLFPSFCRIELTKQSINYKGPLIWNKIPLSLRENKSFKSFKKQLHQHVMKDL